MSILNRTYKSSLTLASLAFASSTFGATLQVTTTADNPISPNPCTLVAGTTYSCLTLRDAINAANSMPGQDSITFDQIDRTNVSNNCTIAAGDVNKVCKIKISTSPLPKITESVIIDGTIPEGRPNIPGSVINPTNYATLRPGIELSGELLTVNTSIVKPGLWLNGANNSTIQGLVINRFPGPGILANISNNLQIFDNYLGTDATGTIASTWNANSSACTANCYGNGAIGSYFNGIGIVVGTADSAQIGGTANNQRNVSSNNYGPGISATEITNSDIAGNFLGTDVYGVGALGNRVENVEIRGYSGPQRAQLGLTPPLPSLGADSLNNKIDSNLALNSKTRSGIRLLGRTQLFKTSASDPGTIQTNTIRNTTIVNNLVGVNLAGNAVPNPVQGALSVNDSVIGANIGFEMVNGVRTPEPNTFVNNTRGGVVINNDTIPIIIGSNPPIGNLPASQPTKALGIAILYNIIFNNSNLGGIGIDLAAGVNHFTGDGVTLNDSQGHSDNVPNHLQNFPMLNAQMSFINPSLAQIYGSLDSMPNRSYLIQAFSDPLANPTGYGEGKSFNGEMVVTTDGNGHVDFHFPAKDGILAGNILSATATDLTTNETSEFGPAVDVTVHGSARAFTVVNGGDSTPALSDDLNDEYNELNPSQ